MRRVSALFIFFILLAFLSACAAEKDNGADEEQSQNMERQSEIELEILDMSDETGEAMIYAYIGGHVLEIKSENNSSSGALLSLLAEGDVTVDMHDYGNFEKVGPLGSILPANDEKITTEPGDVILYQGN